MANPKTPGTPKAPNPMANSYQNKMKTVMGEFSAGGLHSGSKTGPLVKNRKQAVAIAINAGKKAKGY